MFKEAGGGGSVLGKQVFICFTLFKNTFKEHKKYPLSIVMRQLDMKEL